MSLGWNDYRYIGQRVANVGAMFKVVDLIRGQSEHGTNLIRS
ncbi:hypothetical protein ACNQFZ_08695 [Schinkia sp. CFF1]